MVKIFHVLLLNIQWNLRKHCSEGSGDERYADVVAEHVEPNIVANASLDSDFRQHHDLLKRHRKLSSYDFTNFNNPRTSIHSWPNATQLQARGHDKLTKVAQSLHASE